MVTRIHPLLIQSITNNKKNIYKAIFQIKLTRRSFSQSLPQPLPLSQSLQHQKEEKMRPLTIDGLNPALLKVQYAVRGELAIKAETLREKLKESDHGLPFDKVISSNIGNPQQKGLDQPPITFTRQVSIIIIVIVRRLGTVHSHLIDLFVIGRCSHGMAGSS